MGIKKIKISELPLNPNPNSFLALGVDALNESTASELINLINTIIESRIVNLLDYRGAFDASSNSFPSNGGSGVAGAILKGDLYIVSVAGSLGGADIQIGDFIIANVDSPGQIASNWNTFNTNISYVPENQANKSTSVESDAGSNSKYPSVKAVKDYADSLVVGLWDDRGNYDASGNVFPSTGGSGSSGDVLRGDIWTISVAGTLGGALVKEGQTVRALVDTPGQTVGNWEIGKGSAVLIFGNGLNESGGTAKLGGELATEAKVYNDLNGFQYGIKLPGGTSNEVIIGELTDSGKPTVSITSTGIIIRDGNSGQIVISNGQVILNGGNAQFSQLGGLSGAVKITLYGPGHASAGDAVVFDSKALPKGLGDAGDYSANKTDYSYITLKMLNNAVMHKWLEREIMFYSTQEVIIQHTLAESITSANLSVGITAMEYSDDAGATWFDPAYPITVIAGNETIWRVKVYSGDASSGNVIINSTLV